MCSQLVKGHAGPHGQGKCIFGLVTVLAARVENLEKAIADNETRYHEDLERQEDLYQKRIDGLMATISSLEERISSAEERSSADKLASTKKKERQECSKGKRSPRFDDAAGVHEDAGAVEANCREAQTLEAPERDGVQEIPPVRVMKPADKSSCSRELRKDVEVGGTINPPTQGWSEVVRSKPRAQPKERSLEAAARIRSQPRRIVGLKGAEKTSIRPYHLSGISLDCTAEDVISFCRNRRVVATGCFILRPRVRHATLSAKIFMDSSTEEQFLNQNFWPSFINCRPWSRLPPTKGNVPEESVRKTDKQQQLQPEERGGSQS